MIEKLKSRKLAVAVGLLLALLGAAVGNELPWAEAVDAMVKVAMAYLIGQGVADAGEKALPALAKLSKKD